MSEGDRYICQCLDDPSLAESSLFSTSNDLLIPVGGKRKMGYGKLGYDGTGALQTFREMKAHGGFPELVVWDLRRDPDEIVIVTGKFEQNGPIPDGDYSAAWGCLPEIPHSSWLRKMIVEGRAFGYSDTAILDFIERMILECSEGTVLGPMEINLHFEVAMRLGHRSG
jgi:hypothetical protein